MWSFKSYFNTVLCGANSIAIRFVHSLKLGVKIGIRKWRISKIVSFVDSTCYNRQKKKTSAKIFRYIICADDEQSEDLGIDVSADVRDVWRQRIDSHPQLKTDDIGDALLHALNEVLCGSTNYRQLTPASSSLSCNRTVAIAVKPDFTYWVAFHCTWNNFELENLGFFSSNINAKYFNSAQAISDIKSRLLSQLGPVLTDLSGGDDYKAVDTIKIVVKQLKEYAELTSKMAGTLTKSCIIALRQVIFSI
jgi:hypothetical protein